MLMRKEWRLNPAVPPNGTLAERILASRGLDDAGRIAAFLNPSLENLHDPLLLPDMAKAVEILVSAVTAGEPIVIQGDYDVDGITATALLARFLRRIGTSCQMIIPDRMTDGYGLTDSAVSRILASGCRVLVTVDCGIASLEEISHLKQAGLQVVVTDHHECRQQLPDADAIVNPKRPDSCYPFRGLAGVGVALKLVQALCLRLDRGDLWQADLELAALGTVADVVPLTDENRIIVSVGLNRLPLRRQCGLTALLDQVGQTDKPVTAQTFGYVLAPRLNAAGRLGHANDALALLMTDDPAEATAAANGLSELNRRRQELESAIMGEAVQIIDSSFDFNSSNLIIVARDNWHQGVIGIVAARLADQYCRPVIVLSGESGVFRGSSRTWGDYDILAAIEAGARHTVKFGGHRKAAGLVVEAGQLADFCQAVNEHASRTLDTRQMRPIMQADLEIDPRELTVENARAILNLAPFGEDNPQPQLICRGLQLLSVRLTGNGRHLKVQLSSQHNAAGSLDGIGFGLGEADDLFAPGDPVDLLFALDLNTWMNRTSVQLTIRDMAHSAADDMLLDSPWLAEDIYTQSDSLQPVLSRFQVPLTALRPSREEYKAVYQFIRARYGGQPLLADLSLLARRIARSYRNDLNGFRLARILGVFHETGLINLQKLGDDRVRLTLLPDAARVRLEDSPTFQRLQAEEGN